MAPWSPSRSAPGDAAIKMASVLRVFLVLREDHSQRVAYFELTSTMKHKY